MALARARWIAALAALVLSMSTVGFIGAVAGGDEPMVEDHDGDGVPDDVDNCPDVANADQLDIDSNGVGEACEPVGFDSDGDGAEDILDNCPSTPNSCKGHRHRGSTTGLRSQGCMVIPAGPGGGVETCSGRGP